MPVINTKFLVKHHQIHLKVDFLSLRSENNKPPSGYKLEFYINLPNCQSAIYNSFKQAKNKHEYLEFLNSRTELPQIQAQLP